MISINLAKYNLKPNEEAELSQTITNALIGVAKEASKRGRESAYVWKSVEDELPELHEEEIQDDVETIKCMVSEPFLAYTDRHIVAVCVYSVQDNREFWNEDCGTEHKVTHWMPLPVKPRGAEDA